MTCRILLVEDEPIIAGMLSGLLADEGYDVTCAMSAEEALLCVEADPGFRVLVTDVDLNSEVDGIAIANALASHALAGTILISGGSPRSLAQRAPVGAVILEKPFRPTALLEEVGRIDRRPAA